MFTGTLINDLFDAVERAQADAGPRHNEPPANAGQCAREKSDSRSESRSEPEQFPQPLRLSPADWNLGLLLIVHAQLVRALEPRDDFADAVDVYQVGAVRPPEKIRV